MISGIIDAIFETSAMPTTSESVEFQQFGKNSRLTLRRFFLTQAAKLNYQTSHRYVLAHKDLKRVWSKSDKDIDQWGRWHWANHGEKEGRQFTPIEEITTVTAVLQPEPNIVADYVGCGVKDLHADGKPDLVFSLDIEIPESAGPISAITHIKLLRGNPAHINDTNNKNPPLGVGWQQHGSLLNNSNGRIQLANPARNNRLWLFACADDKDRPASVYWAEFRLRRDMP